MASLQGDNRARPLQGLAMEIIKLTKSNYRSVVKQAINILKQGGVIVYPTETAYGLGADFFNPQAIKKIYQIKGRNYRKPLSIIASSFTMAQGLVKFDKLGLKLAKKYWPGALTLILQDARHNRQETPAKGWSALRRQSFGASATSGRKKSQISNLKSQTLGLRISSNKLAATIVGRLGRPLTATSANISGKSELYSAKEAVKEFGRRKFKPDLIIDAGRLPQRKVSTIAQINKGRIKILRQGSIHL